MIMRTRDGKHECGLSLLTRFFSLALRAFFFSSFALHAQAQSNVETILYNGTPLNRVDIAITGDGYTASELAKFRNDAALIANRIFDQDPYRAYKTYFNVHRVDVASNQSGADHPERQSFVDTAFDATYNCGGSQRRICVNQTRVIARLQSTLAPGEYDIMLVIVNDSEYGGSGGSVAVASTHTSTVELVLHEVGHSFGLLADEYDYGGTNCASPFEPREVNSTTVTTREQVKWRHWIDAATSLPTQTTTPAVAGLYQGSSYCPTNYYRPTYNSKMRSLGAPFEQINLEQLIRRIYVFVDPIDASAPATSSLTTARSKAQLFSVTPLQPATHTLETLWFVDGVQQQVSGTTFSVNPFTLASGAHTIEAVVRDRTPSVQLDLQNLLLQRRSWTLGVTKSRTGLPRRMRDN